MACNKPIEIIHNEYDVSVVTGTELIALELTKKYIDAQGLCLIGEIVGAYKEILARLEEDK